MITFLEGLYYALKILGLWDKLLSIHEEKAKAQAIADSPETKGELVKTLKEGKF